MQISSDVSGKKGVFSDMNEAIEASKKAQKIVAKMSMDQREAIISKIREKIKENAEILARMGVEETGMGNVCVINHIPEQKLSRIMGVSTWKQVR